MTALGVIFRPQVDPATLRDAATTAERAGLDEFWLWEDCFDHSGIATVAAALAWTERIIVGVGLLPAPLRNPALAAMEFGTLGQLFPGRVDIGLGHGVQEWMEQVGARVASPMTLLREHTDAVRRLLHGEKVDDEGRYVHLREVGLGWPPPRVPRLLVGAVGEKTVALAGEVSDGLILSHGTTPAVLRAKRAIYDEARGDRPGRVVVYVPCVTGEDADARFAAEARAWGMEPSDEVGVCGAADRVADGLRRWVDAGADAIALQPPPDQDVAEFAAWVGERVRPLLA